MSSSEKQQEEKINGGPLVPEQDTPSPAHISDALADNGYALGYNSPVLRNGNTSPGQGRSIRDYEEQLRTLQKENFNLKLRIYILEEKNPGCSANSDGSESLFKQNVDLKVAIESLRKELQEKQAVLEQAVTAFNLMESNQKEMELKYKDQIEQLNQQNQFLQMEIKAMDRNDSQDNFNDLLSKSETDVNATQKVAEIQESLKELENKNIQLVNKLSEYEWNLKEKDDKVNQLEATIDKITYENATLKEQVDNKEKARNEAEADSASDKVTSSCSLGRQHDIQLAEIKRQLLEKTTEHEKACVAIQLFYKEVGKLKRENESLKQSSSNSIGTESMKVKEEQSDVTELRAKVERLQIEADDANLLYSECSKLCATLTLRLEELAMFLDSLLTHKNIFGGLTPDRQSAIRRAINHSLEMSRSINNMSMMSVTGERSTLEMSAFMNMSCENKENIMSAKLFENLRDDVATLRNELEISVQRTSSIDPSLSRVKKRTSQHNESQSEAEEWSEPDRNVSLARIGLESGPKTALRDKYESNESSGSKPTVSEEKLSLSSKKQLVYKTETRKLSERVTQLELDLAEKQLHLEQYEAQAKVRNDEWKKDRNLMKELKTELESMGKTNKQLIQELENAHLQAISTNPNDSIVNNLEIELKEKTDKIKHLLNDNETLVKRLQLAEKNLEEEQKKFNKNLKEQQERMEILMLQQNDRHRDEMEKKISEFQKTLARDWVSKSIYDEELHRVRELDVKLKENLIKMEYLEDHEKALQQQVASSAAKYEKLLDTREKLQVERNQFESQMKIIQQKHDDLSLEKIKLNSRIAFLENANAMLQKRLIMGPQGGVSSTSTSGIMRSVSYSNASKYMNSDHHSESMSGYTSEEFQPDHKRLDDSSPDLGIESGDSQVKTVSPRNALQRSLEISQSLMNILKEELSTDDESPSKIMKSPSGRTIKPVHDCEAIENENLELKRKLLRTRKAFMDTWNNLKAANLQKERVVNDIRHQVQLTHKVLKQAKGLQADKKV